MVLGNAPAHVLLDRIAARRRIRADVPRRLDDYSVTLDGTAVGVGLEQAVSGAARLYRLA